MDQQLQAQLRDTSTHKDVITQGGCLVPKKSIKNTVHAILLTFGVSEGVAFVFDDRWEVSSVRQHQCLNVWQRRQANRSTRHKVEKTREKPVDTMAIGKNTGVFSHCLPFWCCLQASLAARKADRERERAAAWLPTPLRCPLCHVSAYRRGKSRAQISRLNRPH